MPKPYIPLQNQFIFFASDGLQEKTRWYLVAACRQTGCASIYVALIRHLNIVECFKSQAVLTIEMAYPTIETLRNK